MSVLTDLIYGGSHAVAGLTEGAVNDAIAKFGAEKAIAFPDTAYFFPTIYAATGVKVAKLGDLPACVGVLKSLITNQEDLGQALNAGLATAVGAEIIEGLKYVEGGDPYAAESGIGFVPDPVIRSLGVPLVTGDIPGVPVILVKGEDGLYYKLNFDGETVESEQTEYNSLNGSIITAKSITASKISVTDLVAFDATIGGFKITDSSIYSGVKSTADNTTRGIYLDKEGQLSVGDSSNFLRYFKDKEGQYHLELSASSIRLAATGEAIDETIEDMKDSVSNAMVDQDQQFYASTSPTELVGGEWQSSPPAWKDGIYIWSRTLVTYGNGSEQYVPDETGICITGNTGPAGGDGEQGPPGTDGKPGEKGEDGTGIESIITEYYMSTSKESPSGGEWIDIMPSWSSGMYLWIRSKITYTNPSSVEYTEPYCDSSWEAVNDVEVGGRNLIIRNGEHESQAYIMDEAAGSELSADETSNAMEGYISVTPGEELTFQKAITEGYFRCRAAGCR